MNQYEVVERLEKFLDDAHLKVTAVIDEVFVQADMALDALKERLPEAEDVDVNTPPTETVGEPSIADMLDTIRRKAREATGKDRTAWDKYNPTGPFGEAFIKSLYQQVLDGKLFNPRNGR